MDLCLSNLDIDYDRISTSKYTQENVSEWKHLLANKSNYKLPVGVAGYSITVLEFLKNWLNTTDDNQLVIMRDCVDFDLCSATLQYNWDFDWKYMMTRLPYDWDCFQFGFENLHLIPFYMHSIMPASTFGPSLLNKRYVKKLIRLHYKDGKYNLNGKIANLKFGLKS